MSKLGQIASTITIGAVATASAARAVGVTLQDSLELALLAGSAALVTGVVGLAILRMIRNRSISLQLNLIIITAVSGIAIGSITAARLMFISFHDLRALVVLLLAAATAGSAVCLMLGLTVAKAARDLRSAARSIGQGEDPDLPPWGPEEFRGLASELQLMHAKLEEARQKERALESSRRELVAWVSHDLRFPLAGIRAMAEALEDHVVEDPETVERYHRSMRQEVDRLARLIDDLFELSRISAGAISLELCRMSLGDLVSDAIAAAESTARARGVKLEGRVNGHSPELYLSPPEMGRVFRNLLENAIRHTPADGAVWVDAGVVDHHAYVSVADGCGGIPADDIDRVFDMAFRGIASRTPEAQSGGGVGLAIARGIVEAHRGVIEVTNHGAGCRFVVKLPLGEGATVS
ncbi:MAG: HAMP domain-containing sensor histidine kinase [Actinomycetota bacterium]